MPPSLTVEDMIVIILGSTITESWGVRDIPIPGHTGDGQHLACCKHILAVEWGDMLAKLLTHALSSQDLTCCYNLLFS